MRNCPDDEEFPRFRRHGPGRDVDASTEPYGPAVRQSLAQHSPGDGHIGQSERDFGYGPQGWLAHITSLAGRPRQWRLLREAVDNAVASRSAGNLTTAIGDAPDIVENA